VVEQLIITIYTFTPLLSVVSQDLILVGNEHKNTSLFGSSREFGTGEGCLIYLRVAPGRGARDALTPSPQAYSAVPYNELL
jgi:hypothetical protein